MGLFDNLSQNQPAGGSGFLFGSTPASSAPQSKPLFSFTQTGQAGGTSSAGGLFGSTTASTSAPAAGGLFGAAPSSQAQQGPGLFGNLGKSQPQPSTTAGGSTLFGGLGASTQPAIQSGPLGASLLSGLGQSQQTTSQGQLADPNTQSKSTSALQAAYFDQILERGRKRNNQENGLNGLGDLPTLQLGLGDIARKVRHLGQGGPEAVRGKPSDSKA
jgi:nuclear pore complex protein Nup93